MRHANVTTYRARRMPSQTSASTRRHGDPTGRESLGSYNACHMAPEFAKASSRIDLLTTPHNQNLNLSTWPLTVAVLNAHVQVEVNGSGVCPTDLWH